MELWDITVGYNYRMELWECKCGMEYCGIKPWDGTVRWNCGTELVG